MIPSRIANRNLRFFHQVPAACLGIAMTLALPAAMSATAKSAGKVEKANSTPVLRAVSGGKQQTVYAAQFAAPLVVWVTEPGTHHALSGVRVNFTAEPGIALSAPSVETDEAGLARVTVTGLKPCHARVTAQLADANSGTAFFDDLVVNKATLTIVPAGVQSTPGVVPPISTYTIEGFVNGDTESTSNITGTPTLSTTATNKSRYGNYAIKGGVGSMSSPNYTFVAGFSTLAIVAGPIPKELADVQEPSLTAPSAQSKDPVVQATVVHKFTTTLVMENASTPGTGKVSDAPALNGATAGARQPETTEAPIRSAIEEHLATTPSASYATALGSAQALHASASQPEQAASAPIRAGLLQTISNGEPAKLNVLGIAQVHTVTLPSSTPAVESRQSAAPIHKAITQTTVN
jgi:hypothetical protein